MLTLVCGEKCSGKTDFINSILNSHGYDINRVHAVGFITDGIFSTPKEIEVFQWCYHLNDALIVNHPEYNLSIDDLNKLVRLLIDISGRGVNIYLEMDADKSGFLISYIDNGLIEGVPCVKGHDYSFNSSCGIDVKRIYQQKIDNLVIKLKMGDVDEELRCIAIGHDLIEDCEVTYTELRESGFSERIIDGIRCLTKICGETYDEYKAKVKSNPDAIQVKIADLTHNTRIDRLKGVTEKDMARMARYFQFYMELISYPN